MAYNWLMMTSSGDDNRPSGSLGLLTDKTTKKIKIKINRRQSKKPPSLRLRGLTSRLTNVKTGLFKLLGAHKNTTKYLATTFCEKTLLGNNLKDG